MSQENKWVHRLAETAPDETEAFAREANIRHAEYKDQKTEIQALRDLMKKDEEMLKEVGARIDAMEIELSTARKIDEAGVEPAADRGRLIRDIELYQKMKAILLANVTAFEKIINEREALFREMKHGTPNKIDESLRANPADFSSN